MADNLSKGLTDKAPFKADTAVPARAEKTQRPQKSSQPAGKGKGGKSFKFC